MMPVRAQFLKQALLCLEEKDGRGLHEMALELDVDAYDAQLEVFTEEDNRIFNELFGELTRNTGERLATERTRLRPASSTNSMEIMKKHCTRLSSNAKKFLTAGISLLEKAPTQIRPEEQTLGSEEADALDCHYASEVVEKLGMIVDRALRLERLPVGNAPNVAVKRYFQEAHDCYLYGFDIACAALCRAILESALKDVIAPNDRDGISVVGLVHEAKNRGILTDERASWAIEIYGAGNLAIHGYQKFEKRYQSKKLEELFWKARAVVEDLYRK